MTMEQPCCILVSTYCLAQHDVQESRRAITLCRTAPVANYPTCQAPHASVFPVVKCRIHATENAPCSTSSRVIPVAICRAEAAAADQSPDHD